MARRKRQLVALAQRLKFAPPAGTVVAVPPLKTGRCLRLGRAIQAVLQSKELRLALIKAAALQRPQVLVMAAKAIAQKSTISEHCLLQTRGRCAFRPATSPRRGSGRGVPRAARQKGTARNAAEGYRSRVGASGGAKGRKRH